MAVSSDKGRRHFQPAELQHHVVAALRAPQLALPAPLRAALEAELAKRGSCGGWASLPWRRPRLQLVTVASFWPHLSVEVLGSGWATRHAVTTLGMFEVVCSRDNAER